MVTNFTNHLNQQLKMFHVQLISLKKQLDIAEINPALFEEDTEQALYDANLKNKPFYVELILIVLKQISVHS